MVIPPENLEIDQETYRELMTLRERIERRDVSLESVGDDGRFDVADGAVPSADVPEFVAALKARLLDEPLPEPHDEIVADALAELAAGDWDAAATRLRETYESVCEREDLELGNGTHPVACHLHGEARDRTGSPDSWTGQSR